MSRFGTLIEVDAEMRPLRTHRAATADEWAQVVEQRARWSAQHLGEHPDYTRDDVDAECPPSVRALTVDGGYPCELSTLTDPDAIERVWAEYQDGRVAILHRGEIATEGSCPDRAAAERLVHQCGYEPIGGWRGEAPSVLVLIRPSPERATGILHDEEDAGAVGWTGSL